MRAEVDKQIKKLLEDNVIRPSKSSYNSPIWIVPKKMDVSGEKKYRMVKDYKKLNAVTIPDRYPIPDKSIIITNLGNTKVYTTIDLTSGFHQIKMNEADIHKTAFSVMNGKYEFLRLPFGLKNAPSIFQRMIDDVLRDYIGICCYVYIDDVIIFSNNKEEHLHHLQKIFAKLVEANLKVNLNKTEFLKSEVEYLGFLITSEGIRRDPKKMNAVANIQPPTNLKVWPTFILSTFYKEFCNYCETIESVNSRREFKNYQKYVKKSHDTIKRNPA